jgi:hypothetical protein
MHLTAPGTRTSTSAWTRSSRARASGGTVAKYSSCVVKDIAHLSLRVSRPAIQRADGGVPSVLCPRRRPPRRSSGRSGFGGSTRIRAEISKYAASRKAVSAEIPRLARIMSFTLAAGTSRSRASLFWPTLKGRRNSSRRTSPGGIGCNVLLMISSVIVHELDILGPVGHHADHRINGIVQPPTSVSPSARPWRSRRGCGRGRERRRRGSGGRRASRPGPGRPRRSVSSRAAPIRPAG